MSDELRLYAPIQKIDEEHRQVFGFASTETRDHQGEIIVRSAVEAALPSYLHAPAVREMHQPSAVGKGIEAEMTAKGLWFGASVVDDMAWKKVKSGVYRGFSIGGRVTKRDPDDRTIVLGIDLQEISLVDRPANPDASFTIVKRADGVLRLQPVQFWACGTPGHTHLAKSEASACMEADALRRQATATNGGFTTLADARDEAMETSRRHEGAAARERAAVERARRNAELAAKADDTTAHDFHKQLADFSDALASHHERVARHYRDVADRYGSEVKMDTGSVSKIVADAEAAMGQLAKATSEGIDPTPPGNAHEAQAHGLDNDASAIERIADAVRGHADAAAARANGDQDQAKHRYGEAKARESVAAEHHRMAASYHELVSSHIKPEAGQAAHGTTQDSPIGKAFNSARRKLAKKLRKHCDNYAVRCETLAKDYDQFAARARSEDRHVHAAEYADVAKALRDVAAHRSDLGKKAGIIVTQLDDMAELKDEDPNAGDFKDRGSRSGAMAQLASDTVERKEGETTLKADGEEPRKVKKSSKLYMIAGNYLDLKGNFFGKREFSDDKRQQLADKGHALPDGSYPIENKEDLKNAVQAFGRAKDKGKAKAHIKARAKALGASDELPDGWNGGDDAGKARKAGDFGDKKAPPFGAKDGKGGDDDDDEDDGGKDDKSAEKAKKTKKAIKPHEEAEDDKDGPDGDMDDDDKAACKTGTKPAKRAKVAKQDNGDNGDDDEDCDDVGDSARQDCEDAQDDAEKSRKMGKADLRKAVSAIRALGTMLAEVEAAIGKKSVRKLAKLGSAGKAFDRWLLTGKSLLSTLIADGLVKVAEGRDIEASLVKVAGRDSHPEMPAWAEAVGSALRGSALTKGIPDADRSLRGALAETVDRVVRKATKDRVQRQHDKAVDLGALCKPYAGDDTNASGSGGAAGHEVGSGKPTALDRSHKAILEERNDAVRMVRKMTEQIAPVVRSVQDLRKEVSDTKDRLGKAEAEKAAMAERLRRVEDQPMPSLAKGPQAIRAISKEADGADDRRDATGGLLDRINSIPRGPERAQAILREAYHKK